MQIRRHQQPSDSISKSHHYEILLANRDTEALDDTQRMKKRLISLETSRARQFNNLLSFSALIRLIFQVPVAGSYYQPRLVRPMERIRSWAKATRRTRKTPARNNSSATRTSPWAKTMTKPMQTTEPEMIPATRRVSRRRFRMIWRRIHLARGQPLAGKETQNLPTRKRRLLRG